MLPLCCNVSSTGAADYVKNSTLLEEVNRKKSIRIKPKFVLLLPDTSADFGVEPVRAILTISNLQLLCNKTNYKLASYKDWHSFKVSLDHFSDQFSAQTRQKLSLKKDQQERFKIE